jgi:hypothetical protein
MTLSQSFSTPTAGTSVRDDAGHVLGSVLEIVFDAATGTPRFAVVELNGDSTFMGRSLGSDELSAWRTAGVEHYARTADGGATTGRL